MKFDQIAYRVLPGNTFEATMAAMEQIYGLTGEWVHDEVVANGMVFPNEGTQQNKAQLAFNYVNGLELEVIQYLDGKNFHAFVSGPISHMGIHMDDADEYQRQFEALMANWRLFQHVTTESHTNPYLLEQRRRYEYAIFDTRPITGTFTKLIKRIQEGT